MASALGDDLDLWESIPMIRRRLQLSIICSDADKSNHTHDSWENVLTLSLGINMDMRSLFLSTYYQHQIWNS